MFYVNVVIIFPRKRTVGDLLCCSNFFFTYAPQASFPEGKEGRSGLAQKESFIRGCCWLLFVVHQRCNGWERERRDTNSHFISWPVMASKKDLDEISLSSLVPMVGQGETRLCGYTPLTLLGRDAVTRDLGDSVTGTKDPMPFVPWWMDSELGNLCTARSGRPL